MGKRVWSLVLASFFGAAAHAAPPLVPGDIVVAGYPYSGEPTGACTNQICRVDPVTGATTAISAALPLRAVDLAIESATSVLVLLRSGSFPLIGTVVRLDVTSGTFVTLSTGFATQPTRLDPDPPDPSLVVTPAGRIFTTTPGGILEIDAASGTISILEDSEEWNGLAVEPGGSLLTTHPIGCGPPPSCFNFYDEFVRIDPETAIATPLDDLVASWTSQVLARADGSRVSFARHGDSFDGRFFVWRPDGTSGPMFGSEDHQASVGGMALEAGGTLLVGADGHPDSDSALIELRRHAVPSGAVLASFDQDYGIGAIDVFMTACSDGADNDGDGAADLADVGCANATSDNESPRCDDGIDNDGDGTVDWDGGGTGLPADAVCIVATIDREGGGGGGCGVGAELVALLAGLRLARSRQISVTA